MQNAYTTRGLSYLINPPYGQLASCPFPCKLSIPSPYGQVATCPNPKFDSNPKFNLQSQSPNYPSHPNKNHPTPKIRIAPTSFIANSSPFTSFINDTPTIVTTAISSGKAPPASNFIRRSTGAIVFCFNANGLLSTKSPRFLNLGSIGVYPFFCTSYL